MSGTRFFILACAFVGLAGPAGAQEATKEEMNHDFIFDFSGLPKQEIYARTMRWITNNLRARKVVVQTDDPETGTIVANGLTTMTAEGDSQTVSLSFRLAVDVREGKERVRFLEMQVSRGPDQGWDDIPREGAWHRGAQKRLTLIARIISDYIRLKGGQ
jgi:hypothetical protein